MPTRPHPVRPSPNALMPPLRARRPRPRPWPALTPQAQTQLAQQIARLVRRLCPTKEVPHADHAE